MTSVTGSTIRKGCVWMERVFCFFGFHRDVIYGKIRCVCLLCDKAWQTKRKDLIKMKKMFSILLMCCCCLGCQMTIGVKTHKQALYETRDRIAVDKSSFDYHLKYDMMGLPIQKPDTKLVGSD